MREHGIKLTEVDDDMIDDLCDLIEEGHPKVKSLKSLGINYTSFQRWLKKGEAGTHPRASYLLERYTEAVQKSIKSLEQEIEERPTRRVVNKDADGNVTSETEIWDVRSLNLIRTFRLGELAELDQKEALAGTPMADAAAMRQIASRLEREHLEKKGKAAENLLKNPDFA